MTIAIEQTLASIMPFTYRDWKPSMDEVIDDIELEHVFWKYTRSRIENGQWRYKRKMDFALVHRNTKIILKLYEAPESPERDAVERALMLAFRQEYEKLFDVNEE